MKSSYKKPTDNIILNGERLNVFSLRLGRRQGCLLLSPLLNIILELLANTVSQEKEIKCIHFRKEEIKLALFAHDMVVAVENPKKSKK